MNTSKFVLNGNLNNLIKKFPNLKTLQLQEQKTIDESVKKKSKNLKKTNNLSLVNEALIKKKSRNRFPSLLTEILSRKNKINRSVFSTGSMTERKRRPITGKNKKLNDQVVSFRQRQQNILLNKNVSKLIQFKSISHELNEAQKHKFSSSPRKPQFSSEINSELRSRNPQKDLLIQSYTSKPIYIPKLKMSSFIVKSTSTLTGSGEGTSTKRRIGNGLSNRSNISNLKGKLNKLNTRNRIRNTKDISTNETSSPNELKSKRPLQQEIEKKEEEEKEEKEEKEFLPSEMEEFHFLFMEIDGDANAKKDEIKKKTLSNIKSIVKNARPGLEGIEDPYPPLEKTIREYLDKITYSKNGFEKYVILQDNMLSFDFKRKQKFYYSLSTPELLILIQKYFECYNELADEVVWGDQVEKFGENLFANFRRKLPKSNDHYEEYFSDEKYDINNNNYIDRYIQTDYGKDMDEEIRTDDVSTKSIRSSQKKRNKRQNASSICEPLIKTSAIKAPQKNNYFAFSRVNAKVDNYAFLKHKQNLSRLTNEKLNIFIEEHIYPEKNRNLKYQFDKLFMNSVKKPKNYVKKPSHLTKEEVFNKLQFYILSGDTKTFMKVYRENKNELDKEYKDKKGNTMLSLAVQDNVIEIVEFLLENGANPNTQNVYLNTPLHYAASHKHFEVANLLIKFNADEKIRNKYGQTPWECEGVEREEDRFDEE